VLDGLTKGNYKAKEQFLIGTLDTDQGAVDRHCWADGRRTFESTTGHLRHLIAKQPKEEHVGICKWRMEIPGVPPGPDIWKAVWRPYRADGINQFLWQVAYRIPASKYYAITRGWVPELLEEEDEVILRDDPRMWCDRCDLHECEDLFHLLWKCPESQAIWE
jgi:hypothetical protein